MKKIVLLVSGAMLAIAPSVSAEAGVPVDPEVYAITAAEAESKSRMLQAKSELWRYGTTAEMVVHPDGMSRELSRSSR